MDPGFRSPLIDFFRRGEVARDVRLLAAQGALAPRAQEQLALLVLLADDPDPEIRRAAGETLDALPLEPLRAFLARSDTPPEMRAFFAALGVEVPAGQPPADMNLEEPLLDTLSELPEDPGPADPEHKMLSTLPVLDRMKLAMKGTREQRATLIRDSNKLVSAAVLSSPKVNEAEIEAFTKMGNVSEDVMRIIGQNRAWTKNYGVILGLCKHPKTPPAIAMSFVQRLSEKDLKIISTDRNAKDGMRLLAKKMLMRGKE
ncbi:MAG TPA: hypothetical protein VF921_00625 [Vicinamibacterales bacterium]